GADRVLGPQMKAVGEVMAIGRTLPEALQKAMRALDIGITGFGSRLDHVPPTTLRIPTAQRLSQVAAALYDGVSQEEVIQQTQFDPWFVQQMAEIIEVHRSVLSFVERRRSTNGGGRGNADTGDSLLEYLDAADFMKLKTYGFSDAYIAQLIGDSEEA